MRDRLFSFLYAFFRTRWIPLLLITVMAGLFGGNVAGAEWVQDNSPFINNTILGLVFGAALASSMFSGRFAAVYSLAVSVACTFQQIGHVMPGAEEIASLQFFDLLWVMHTRLLTLIDRVEAWRASFLQGENIRDTGLFVLLVGLLVWNVSVWLVWCVARRRNALEGILPIGLLFAVNVQLRQQGLEELTVFIFCGILLLIYASFAGLHHDWNVRRVDYPDMLGVSWAFSGALLAVLITLLARAAPFVGTPEGWHALNDLFHPAVQQMTDTSERLFSDVKPPPLTIPVVSARTPDLGNIGAPIPQGSETVMWVATNDPAPLPPQAGMVQVKTPRHYWASGIFATYNGRGWEPLDTSNFAPSSDTRPEQVVGRYELQQQFDLPAAHGNTLFAASLPLTASQGVALHLSPLGDSATLQGTLSKYTVSSWTPDPGASDLVQAPANYPPEITASYLQLPATLPERVRTFTARITSGAGDPYEKALRIQNYLRLTFSYKLNVPAPPPNRDAVDYFLFDSPSGYCTYFASAMAVMLRTQGVPARVVSGYAMGEYDFQRRAYRVSVDAAHAWVQVYFPGSGWVEFEPTPAYGTFDYQNKLANTLTPADLPKAPPSNDPWTMLSQALCFVVLLAIAAVPVWLWLQISWGGQTPRQQTQFLYWRTRRFLAWAGLGASASDTPYEFLSKNESRLVQRPRVRDALTYTTSLYINAMFSPAPPALTDIKNARQLWRRALVDWLALGIESFNDFARDKLRLQ